MFEIYVQLLNEGTIVYRPVPATIVAKSICDINGEETYDLEVETWEFPPGSRVTYAKKNLQGELVPVAISLIEA